jgi:hypothetical protein
MWSHGAFGLWRAAYRRVVRSSFATVPFYRYRWALDGRTDPVLVAGRTGTDGGAVHPADVERALVDLIPLAGGRGEADPSRGLGHVLGRLPAGAVVAVLDGEPAVAAELATGRVVVAVGSDKQLTRLIEAVPPALATRLHPRPRRELDRLDGVPHGVIHDRLLGYLGAVGGCGRWHLDWTRVYARETGAGLAITLLRQDSPRFVDVLVGGGVPGRVTPCPRHGTPVVRT